jgi:Uma2 family endonuclease
MGSPKAKRSYTVAKYLQLERAADERHEFLDGKILEMASEGGEHADISVNLAGTLGSQLKGKPCRARTKLTKVRSAPVRLVHVSKRGMYSYPDIVVICGEPEYHDEFRDVILNPAVIVEVLSPSTEAFDRGKKFLRYQTWNPTLKDYLLVSQDQPQIEHFSRKNDGEWLYRRYTGLKATLKITSIGCSLKLADVYDRVAFPKK